MPGSSWQRLLNSTKKDEPLILAIPRGGVAVSYYVTCELDCELSVVIS